MQRLEEAIASGMAPNSKSLSQMTLVQGFDDRDPVVALAAGYVLWTALTASGRVYVCETGFDGYAGMLPTSVEHGGWNALNQV
jgi:hypothetical protein